MKSRLLPNPALTLLLALLWLLLSNALSVGHLVLGLVLGWAIPLLVQGFLVDLPKVRRPLKLCLFLLKVCYDIVVANVISLTPGTVSAALRPGHKMLLIHALDAPDTEALVDEVKNRYETPLLEIFECSRT